MNPFLSLSMFSRVALAAVLVFGAAVPQARAADETAVAGSGSLLDATWSRWQGRVGLGAPTFRADAGRRFVPGDTLQGQGSLSLLGDYYFTQQGIGAQDSYGGGFRATGGLFVGQRTSLWLATPASLSAFSTGIVAQRRGFSLLAPSGSESFDGGSVPYVGVGYTGLKSLRATGGGWGFSADVGLMALQPRSVVRLGQQGLSDSLRELQLSPMLQLGVSYSF